MRIKDLTDLVHGQNYYIYSLKISNSFGIERIGKVQKVKFIDGEGCENIYHGYGHLLKRGKFILNNRTFDVYSWRYRIFDNYDEAVSEYNKEVLNTLDRLDSFYQEHKKRIKNLLYDRK